MPRLPELLATDLLLKLMDLPVIKRNGLDTAPNLTWSDVIRPYRLDDLNRSFNPKVPGSRPGRPTESQVTGL